MSQALKEWAFSKFSCPYCGEIYDDKRSCCCENHNVEIRTEHLRPPIPTRNFDWSAVQVGYEPDDPIGRGATEDEAIADLMEQLSSSEEAAYYEELNRGYAQDRI